MGGQDDHQDNQYDSRLSEDGDVALRAPPKRKGFLTHRTQADAESAETAAGRADRLPRTNGHWEGEPGNGEWYSDNAEVQSVTGGEPITFHDGRPNFAPWAKGNLEFQPGQLKGTNSDFPLVHKALADKLGLPNETAAKAWLKEKGLTAHHASATTIQLVPSKLHNNIPHTGSAADLRNR